MTTRPHLIKLLFGFDLADVEARLTRLGYQIGDPPAQRIPATFRSAPTMRRDTSA